MAGKARESVQERDKDSKAAWLCWKEGGGQEEKTKTSPDHENKGNTPAAIQVVKGY